VSIDTLKDDTVIVFIDGSNLYTTPEVVQEAFSHDSVLGSPLPIVGVFDAKLQTMLGVIGHFSIKAPNGFKEIKTALTEYRGKGAPDPKLTERSPENWKDARGRTMRAAFVSSTAEEVTFRLRDGELSTLKLSLLSDASQKRIAQLTKKKAE